MLGEIVKPAEDLIPVEWLEGGGGGDEGEVWQVPRATDRYQLSAENCQKSAVVGESLDNLHKEQMDSNTLSCIGFLFCIFQSIATEAGVAGAQNLGWLIVRLAN